MTDIVDLLNSLLVSVFEVIKVLLGPLLFMTLFFTVVAIAVTLFFFMAKAIGRPS